MGGYPSISGKHRHRNYFGRAPGAQPGENPFAAANRGSGQSQPVIKDLVINSLQVRR